MGAFLTIFWSLAESVLTSRIGQILIAAVVSWFWSANYTSTHWKAVIATEKAAIERAYQEEVIRQQKAAEEIAKAATGRAEQDAQVVSDMQKIIDDYTVKLKEKPHVTAKQTQSDACVVDDHFSSVVQQLSTAASRKTKAPSAPRRVR
jgi:hypothetical protein